MKVIIDRFEGDFAVVELENKAMANLPKVLVPDDAKEGDIIEIIVATKETESRKQSVKKLTKDLWE